MTLKQLINFNDKISLWPNQSGCLEWTASVTEKGYGNFHVSGKTVRAHRIMYELFNGPIPAGLVVRHNCHNRLCVNLDHLLLGTQKENIHDSIRAGRHPMPNARKLTPNQVLEIRRRAIGSGHYKAFTVKLGAEYGISHQTIQDVILRRTWKTLRYQ
ncbi:hypothetical protein LCGC14_1411270 [marine sediment metagenome]|uniref:HNH nuclease domain-containing protein n=1 Tax=marine sediment metagenome TaxID=412755 RepID=A0A0F9JU90_9ZZZZ